MNYSKLYRLSCCRKKPLSKLIPGLYLSSIEASYHRLPAGPIAKTLDCRPYVQGHAHRGDGFLKAQNNLNVISVFVNFFLRGAKAFLGGEGLRYRPQCEWPIRQCPCCNSQC